MNDTLNSQVPHKTHGRVLSDQWLDINNDNLSPATLDDLDTIQILLDHMNLIKELEDQIDAVDYLAANAERLADNPKYTTNDDKILNAILDLGASGNEVNFNLYKYAIEIVLEGYRQMTIISMSGLTNNV